jgi:hypothetical protein
MLGGGFVSTGRENFCANHAHPCIAAITRAVLATSTHDDRLFPPRALWQAFHIAWFDALAARQSFPFSSIKANQHGNAICAPGPDI